MILDAYKLALDEANKLPQGITGPCLKIAYSPRKEAIWFITKRARLDTEALCDSEFITVYNYANTLLIAGK